MKRNHGIIVAVSEQDCCCGDRIVAHAVQAGGQRGADQGRVHRVGDAQDADTHTIDARQCFEFMRSAVRIWILDIGRIGSAETSDRQLVTVAMSSHSSVDDTRGARRAVQVGEFRCDISGKGYVVTNA